MSEGKDVLSVLDDVAKVGARTDKFGVIFRIEGIMNVKREIGIDLPLLTYSAHFPPPDS